MEWADVTALPSTRTLRQFAGLWLVLFVGLAVWRLLHGSTGTGVIIPAAVGLTVGPLGLVRPAAIRLVYTGWMIAAFPIGWTVSRLVLAGLFYVVFTPVAFVFRRIGRDALRLRPRRDAESYWASKAGAADLRSYFRQF